MSAMPPVDKYIFIEKPWQYLDIKMVEIYHVQMWKWIIMIFLCDMFSGARGMLQSRWVITGNHNGKKWWIVGGRCWEKKFLMAIKSIVIVFVPASRWDQK